MNYVTENSFVYSYKHGFCKKPSVDSCLSYLADKFFTKFDSVPLIGIILIGLLKTFDTINHEWKNFFCCNWNQSINWFRCYLYSRRFRVNIEKKNFSIAKFDFRVPLNFVNYLRTFVTFTICERYEPVFRLSCFCMRKTLV